MQMAKGSVLSDSFASVVLGQGGDRILKIFVKMMESGISFSAIIGILFAYYRCKDILKRRFMMAFSLLLGFIFAGISAWIRSIPNFINRTSLSFFSMLPVVCSLVFVLLLTIFHRKISEKNETLYENLLGAALSVYCTGSFFYYVPALLSQLNAFVYYGESAVSTAVLFRVIGYVFAILMMILSAFAVYKCADRLNPNEMTAVFVLTLLIRAIVQLAVIFQRLYSLKLIPRNPRLFSVIAWTINHGNLFDLLQLLCLLLFSVLLWERNRKISKPYKNRAELRKIKYLMQNRRKWALFLAVLLVADMLSVTFVKSYAGREIPLSEPENYSMEEGMIAIPVSELEDGHLHRYLYTAKDGIEMRFIIIKKAQGSYGVGLDACEICGPSGYFERKDQVVCKLCDVVMNKGTIGFAGGCNPIPFRYVVHDRKIKIESADLDALSYVFK